MMRGQHLPRITVSRVGVLFALLLMCAEAGAPVSGIFTGLSDLIKDSEQIVVAEILAGPPSIRGSTINDAQPQEVMILHVIKGTLEPNARITVTLRTLLVVNGGHFEPLERYVLFLRRYGSGSYDLVGVPGSAFWVAPTSHLSNLPTGNVRGSIETLLREAVAEKREEQRSVEQRVAEYLASP